MADFTPEIPGLTIERLIAETPTATVWRCRQPALDRLVAVKILADTSAETRRLFGRERHTLGSLSRHPRIVTVYQSGQFGDRPYLVLQLADQGSLAERLTRGPLAPREARPLAASIVEAIRAVHDAGMTHGDIKPSNVLFDSLSGVLLSDLGMSQLADAAGSVGYTLGYAAPEVLSGGSATPASDMYSLGALIYETITGRLPIDPKTEQSTLGFSRKVASKAIEWPSTITDTELTSLVSRLLSKEPADRPSPPDVLGELAEADKTIRTTATLHPGTERRSRRRAWAWLAAAALLGTVSAWAALSSRGGLGPDTNPLAGTMNGAEKSAASPTPRAPSPATSVGPSTTRAGARVEPWEYLATSEDSWKAVTRSDEVQLEVYYLGDTTPMTPVVDKTSVWVAASRTSAGGTITELREGTFKQTITLVSETPTDRPLVGEGAALFPLWVPDRSPRGNPLLRSVSDDPARNDQVSFHQGYGPAMDLRILKPEPDGDRLMIAMSLPELQDGWRFILDEHRLGTQELAERVFPNAPTSYGEPGPILVLPGSDGDFAFVAEGSQRESEGASITRWPRAGPNIPIPIDPGTSGNIQDVLQLAPDGTAWVVSRERIVSRIDLEQEQVTGFVAAGPCPVEDELTDCAFLRADHSHGLIAHGAFWVGNPVDGSVYRIDLDSVEITDVIEIGGTPGTPAVTDSGVWVADIDTATMYRIDAESREISHRVDLPCLRPPDGLPLLGSPGPIRVECVPWPDGIEWRYRPIGSEGTIWIPWEGLLYRVNEPVVP